MCVCVCVCVCLVLSVIARAVHHRIQESLAQLLASACTRLALLLNMSMQVCIIHPRPCRKLVLAKQCQPNSEKEGCAVVCVCFRVCVCVCVCFRVCVGSSSDFTSETTSVAMDVQSSITYALRIRNTSDRYAANRFQSVPFVGFISVQK